MKQDKGFAILPLALLVAALGLASQGALKVSKSGPTINKPAVSAAFKAGKAEHWKNLNK